MRKKSIYQKELTILKNSVSKKESSEKNILSSPTTIDIINILEKFLQSNDFLCYGGMAINNILPPSKQFYDREKQLPDYDFFSKNALKDSKKLADIYYKQGYENVEAKSGLHEGTYKVYVNFLQIADITQMETKLFQTLKKSKITVRGIDYVPPNFLRMSVYLELSRPDGDVSRWEKIYNRLQLLNNNIPLESNCKPSQLNVVGKNTDKNKIYESVKHVLLEYGCVFFGGFAFNLYKRFDKRLPELYSFDVLVNDLESIEFEINNKLPDINIQKKQSTSKYLPNHILLVHNNVIYARIFKTKACYSYNIHRMGKYKAKIATIYTILSMYLTFTFISKPYFNEFNLLCLCEYILQIYKQNRLKNKGILKNYNLDCYGKQDTFEKIIEKRNETFEKLKKNKQSLEYQKWFLRYNPSDKKNKKTVKK